MNLYESSNTWLVCSHMQKYLDITKEI